MRSVWPTDKIALWNVNCGTDTSRSNTQRNHTQNPCKLWKRKWRLKCRTNFITCSSIIERGGTLKMRRSMVEDCTFAHKLFLENKGYCNSFSTSIARGRPRVGAPPAWRAAPQSRDSAPLTRSCSPISPEGKICQDSGPIECGIA